MSYDMENEDRIEVRPSPAGSQAKPTRGENFHQFVKVSFAMQTPEARQPAPGMPASPGYEKPNGALLNTALFWLAANRDSSKVAICPSRLVTGKPGSQRIP